jgi:type II secretory pathway component PulF
MLSSLVRAGESGGMLEDVLWRVVTFGEQEEELQGKAISALIYPIFLLLVSSSAIFILVSFVFPKFIAFFKDFNAALPWPTLLVMGLCDFMGKFWWAVLIAIGVIVYGTIAYVRTPGGREQRDRLLLRWPIVRRVVQGIEMARFARTLGTLLDNGVPVLTSLRITQDTLSNVLIAAEVAKVHARVTEGDSISESLSQASYFTPLVVNMFAVGEESGRLGAVTRRIADAYDNEVDRAVKAMAALFEPLLIVIMGIIVGFLVIAMLLPMLTLSSNIS